MTKDEFQQYLVDNGLEAHSEFAKTIISTFGPIKSLEFTHQGQQIWPPTEKKVESKFKSVPLTDEMKVLASILGGFRSLTARNCGVSDAKIGPQSGLDSDMDGILGELAFCKIFNVFPDIGLKPRSGSADAIMNEKRIDIKTTRHQNGRLLSTLKSNPDVDIYVLAVIDDANIELRGYALTADLIREDRIKDLGHGKGYAMEQSELRQFK